MHAEQHIVSIGGGLSSGVELPREVLRKYDAENVHFIIAALAMEHPDLWRIIDHLEQSTGKHVTRVSYDPIRRYVINAPESMWWDIWDVFEDQGMMGNSLADPCSRVLKRQTLKHFITDHFDPSNSILHVGITRDEIDRMLAIQRNWGKSGYQVEADLCDIEQHGTREERCMRYLGWIPDGYALGFSHLNCSLFCVKAGHLEMARLLWHYPDTFYYHAERERLFQMRFNTNATIMRDRKTINGVVETTPLTMYEFAERMKAKWAGLLPGFDPFDSLDSTPACKFCESM